MSGPNMLGVERQTSKTLGTYVASTIRTPFVSYRVAARSEVPLIQSTNRSLASSSDATNKWSPPSWNDKQVTGAFPRITAPINGGLWAKSKKLLDFVIVVVLIVQKGDGFFDRLGLAVIIWFWLVRSTKLHQRYSRSNWSRATKIRYSILHREEGYRRLQ